MLRDIGHLRTDYASDMDNLAADFYDPCLRNADQYDRISGFFSSTIFYLLHSALGDFVLTNHGRMRFICSPRLSQSDADGILFGYHARDQRELAEQLERELEEMLSSEHLSDGAHLLASLIASGRMEVRFAVVSDTAETPTRRMFHDKVGLFIDERGDRVGFRGSANETFFGVSSIGNIESIDVWPSWEGGRDLERVTNASARFERLWNDEVTGVRVVSLPEEFRATLEVTAEGSDIETLLSKLTGPKDSPVASPPQVGDIFLRDHQIRAIEKWEANDFIGILAHATGSGKTITALYALQMAMDRQLTPIVFVPSKLLLEQWAAQLSTLGIGVVRVGAGHTKWISQGSVRAAIEASAPDRRFAVVATLASAGSEQFKNQVVSKASHVLAIFDEAHRRARPCRGNFSNGSVPTGDSV